MPRATGTRTARVQQADEPMQAPAECVYTDLDGSCLLFSTDCDILGDEGDNELFGTPDGEIICGLGGDDVLDGGDGEDTLVGGPGADRLTGGPGKDCVLSDGEDVSPGDVDQDYLDRCDRVGSYKTVGGVEYGSAPSTPSPGDVANVGAVYVALTRYASTQGEPHRGGGGPVAVIARRAVSYSQGEIRFLVRCSGAGAMRVTLTATRRDGRRVRLGAATFECQGDGDDPVVSVPLSERGRRLVEASTRILISARVVESGASGARSSAGQTFVLSP
jgi:Ca2+-binding RTX toxin-like protein